MTVTPVQSEEIVFRSVKDLETHFFHDVSTGTLRITSSAFNDPNLTPSVDRSKLLQGGPEVSRRAESDGVVSLLTADVRLVEVATNDADGNPVQRHAADVVHDPVEDNYAHAIIAAHPSLSAKTAFKRLKESLCILAQKSGWAYPPASRRQQTG